MSVRHCNIPIFIPHLGCPNQCVFCNQRSISGCREFSADRVEAQIDTWLSRRSTLPEDTEIAFFGGSFTGIDRELMCRLLSLAQGYVDRGRVRGIRLSTRPDYISDEILSLLSQFSVRHIELGLQSMDDAVLLASRRGHTSMDAERACRAIKQYGFTLTGQMMIGLPQASAESEIATAKRICEMGADSARIYPTVVFYDTPLCEMAMRGEYMPLSLEEAVQRSANAYEIFAEAGVPCIRVGLCATEDLTSAEAVYRGPNHPALGELVMSEVCYREILRVLRQAGLLGETVVLEVPERELSRAIGQHRMNISRLLSETGTRVLRVCGIKDGTQICAYRKTP